MAPVTDIEPLPRLFPCAWVSFSARMPQPTYNPNPQIVSSTHGAILVTNNHTARNRWGAQSHIWLTNTVHTHLHEERSGYGTYVEAYEGEITAYAEDHGRIRIRNLTHWRPAVPEEWEYDADGLPTRCIVSADPADAGGAR